MKVRIWLEGGEWREVEGEKVLIPGYEGFNFFATPAWEELGICITEAQTGCVVASGSNAILAQKAARKNLSKHSLTEIAQAIQTIKKEQGDER